MKNTIKVRVDGPLLCTGDIEVLDADGKVLDKSDDVALCRCGHSSNKPFCDGSHRDAGFSDTGCFTDDKGEPLEGEGPLVITVRNNAMLIAKGPMTINSADGSCTSTRNKAAFCRCGESANKPFCDSSHKECGFTG
jgi:CDGSH-type Zn-finger protein